jgi:uncharacterized Fe-S cluster protein YjdI
MAGSLGAMKKEAASACIQGDSRVFALKNQWNQALTAMVFEAEWVVEPTQPSGHHALAAKAV